MQCSMDSRKEVRDVCIANKDHLTPHFYVMSHFFFFFFSYVKKCSHMYQKKKLGVVILQSMPFEKFRRAIINPSANQRGAITNNES
jgi:hypothetical protein